MVLHEFIKYLTNTPLRIVELYNDRHSYFLTARQWARNLDSNYAFIMDKFGEDVYRRFRLYLWGTAYQFQSGGLDCSDGHYLSDVQVELTGNSGVKSKPER
jgi:cyclopropane-fatty-acyl-phospholipid synthase